MAGFKRYPNEAAFPNTTNLYAWHLNATGSWADEDYIGSKALTQTGTMATVAGPDGTTIYANHNDVARLTSSDAVFNFTGDFTVGCWVYRANWATNVGAAARTLLSNYDGTDGWLWYMSGSSTDLFLFAKSSSTTVLSASYGTSGLAAGWHHLVWTHDDGTTDKLYVDGVEVLDAGDTTNTFGASTQFEIGSYNGTTTEWEEGICEAFVHSGIVYTADQVKHHYNSSTRQFKRVTG